MRTMALLPDVVELPEGWSWEPLSSDNQILICSPSRLMVTVDFDRRGFRSGLLQHGRFTSTKPYRGRGWKGQLVHDAIGHLDAIEKGRK